jgi:hypothetical protein
MDTVSTAREQKHMSSRQPDSESAKKPYAKPEFTQIALRPEEAVLGLCKAANTGSGGRFNPCNAGTGCFAIGS